MSERNFRELLEAQWSRDNFVCVGLDSKFSEIPESAHNDSVANTIVAFNKAIVEVTKDLVCAFKPNIAFYEAHGDKGIAALHQTIVDIHRLAPDVPVILDAKRADIGNTNAGYVEMAFEFLGADAITVSPYLGGEALQPFLERADKGIFVLCRTSNPGASEFQDLLMRGMWGLKPFYQHVAYQVATHWDKNGNCGLVVGVGATALDELREVRKLAGDMPILIPGIGAQGGDVEKVVQAGMDSRGWGVVINSSRGIIFASKDKDFAMAARLETLRLRHLIKQSRLASLASSR